MATQQDRLINGKSYNEIVTFAKDVTIRRRRKYAYSQFSANVQKFINEFESIKSDPNLSIDLGVDKLYGMKTIDFEVNPDTVQKEIDSFFRKFRKYSVKGIDTQYVTMLQYFNEQIDWTDKQSFEPYFNMLQVTFVLV
jgi:septation ring formation regulator EzrA